VICVGPPITKADYELTPIGIVRKLLDHSRGHKGGTQTSGRPFPGATTMKVSMSDSSETQLEGGCSCGSVRYEVRAPLTDCGIAIAGCARCRQAPQCFRDRALLQVRHHAGSAAQASLQRLWRALALR
jgi:hypothetical protein